MDIRNEMIAAARAAYVRWSNGEVENMTIAELVLARDHRAAGPKAGRRATIAKINEQLCEKACKAVQGK